MGLSQYRDSVVTAQLFQFFFSSFLGFRRQNLLGHRSFPRQRESS
jgi:hypothetical protein